MLLVGRFDSFDDLRLPRAFRPTFWPSGGDISDVQKLDHLSRTVPTVPQDRTDDRPGPASSTLTMDQNAALIQFGEC
jgi:hypothetical protein